LFLLNIHKKGYKQQNLRTFFTSQIQDISHPQNKHWFTASVLWNSLWAGWSEDQIPVGDETFCTHPDWPLGPPSHLYNGYWVFAWVKAARVWPWL